MAAAVTATAAQSTRPLAGIDVFGTRAFDAALVRAEYGADLEQIAAGLAKGELDKSFEERWIRVMTGLRARGSFAFLDLAIVNYFAGTPRTFLTVDAVERADSARRMAFAPAPHDTVPDPAGLVASFRTYLAKGFQLLQSGALPPAEEPCAVLHCAPGANHPTLRADTERFTREAPAHRDQILLVLRADHDPENRAAAAFLLGHLTDVAWVTSAVAPAITDPNSTVRNNAMRVLLLIAQHHPNADLPIAPILTALQFPTTTDRNKAAYVLVALADRPENRDIILRTVGTVLLDMLALQQPNNHDPAYEILRKLSGKNFGERDYAAWRGWLRSARND